MAMKTKQELKDVFSGLSSIMLVKGGIANFATVTPDFDLPVTVDTLSLSQAEPTLNRTKVHGLQADWAVTSTAGDITFAATVPSVSKELVEYFLGKTTEIAQATINNQQFKGFSTVLNSKKLNVGFALISDDGEKCLLVKEWPYTHAPCLRMRPLPHLLLRSAELLNLKMALRPTPLPKIISLS